MVEPVQTGGGAASHMITNEKPVVMDMHWTLTPELAGHRTQGEHMSGMSFTAIDFETANNYRASACAVGMAKVRNGRIVEETSWLMKPLPGYDDFLPVNIGVHGITAAQVRGLDDWSTLHHPMLEFIGADALVGHNVSFERSVISRANEACGVVMPDFDYRCTLNLARKHLTLPKYSLSDVVTALSLPSFTHHDAGADAAASAHVALELARRTNASTLDELWPTMPTTKSGGTPSYYASGYARKLADLPRPAPDANPYGPLFGQTLVFSGDLVAMPRAEAQDAAAAKGAVIANSTTKKVTLVVDATAGLPGSVPSGKVRRAMELAAAGQDIEVIGEGRFLRMLAFQ